jgi:hypothetical protein
VASSRGRLCFAAGRTDRTELICCHRLLREQQVGTLVKIGPTLAKDLLVLVAIKAEKLQDAPG